MHLKLCRGQVPHRPRQCSLGQNRITCYASLRSCPNLEPHRPRTQGLCCRRVSLPSASLSEPASLPATRVPKTKKKKALPDDPHVSIRLSFNRTNGEVIAMMLRLGRLNGSPKLAGKELPMTLANSRVQENPKRSFAAFRYRCKDWATTRLLPIFDHRTSRSRPFVSQPFFLVDRRLGCYLWLFRHHPTVIVQTKGTAFFKCGRYLASNSEALTASLRDTRHRKKG